MGCIVQVSVEEYVGFGGGCGVIFFAFSGEILVLVVPIGIHIEYIEIFLSEVGQRGRISVQVKELDIFYLAGQPLCGGR